MKIAFCGPSGTGKTTLADYIVTTYDLNYLQGSASVLLNEELRKELGDKYDYVPSGHQSVINLSSTNPEFGKDFQRFLLEQRYKMFTENTNFITDRSPIDVVAYFLAQVSHNSTVEETEEYITRAVEVCNELTHLIRIRVVNESMIEDNGSRVANIYFQHYMDAVFNYALGLVVGHPKFSSHLQMLTIDIWDLDTRKKTIDNFLGFNE